MTYNYEKAILKDVLDYIHENYSNEEICNNLTTNREEWQETLKDAMWIDDSVTGNGSGSYTINTYQAEENLCHNLHLLRDALEEFGGDYAKDLEKGAEHCDVIIRCYLLDGAISEALDQLERELPHIRYNKEIQDFIDHMENSLFGAWDEENNGNNEPIKKIYNEKIVISFNGASLELDIAPCEWEKILGCLISIKEENPW